MNVHVYDWVEDSPLVAPFGGLQGESSKNVHDSGISEHPGLAAYLSGMFYSDTTHTHTLSLSQLAWDLSLILMMTTTG